MDIVKRDEIDRIKEHINEVFPQAKYVEIKVDELPKVGFRSKIRISAPNRKKIIALKTDKDIRKCLDKSHSAVVRQIHKEKSKWYKRKKKKKSFDFIELAA